MKKLLAIACIPCIISAMTQTNSSSGSPVRTIITKEEKTLEKETSKRPASPETLKVLKQEAKELTKAIWQGNYEKVESILTSGISPTLGDTPLLNIGIRYPAIVKLLLDHGANPNITHPKTGNSALIEAIRGGYVESIRILLNEGANPSIKNKRRQTALALAMELQKKAKTDKRRKQYEEIIKLLKLHYEKIKRHYR